MAESEVSSIIGNILDAFQNGANVFRGTARKHKRRSSGTSHADEDKITLDSLSQRPQEIKRTYDSLVAVHGRSFEIGDSSAQTTLAQILLVFNTGLIKLLNHVLSDDKKSRSHARSAVYSLSETAAMDALIALSELDHRLTTIAKLNAKLSGQSKVNDAATLRKPRSRSSSSSQPMATRRPPPTPRLQNGGWVRSKSDPSSVSVVVASKTKKGDQRKGSPSNSPTMSTLTTATPKAKEHASPPPRYSQLAPRSPPPQPRPKPVHLQSYPASTLTAVPETVERHLVRHPSMYIVPSDFFHAFPASSTFKDESQPTTRPLSSPSVPPKVPIHSRPRQTQIPTQPGIPDSSQSEDQPTILKEHNSPQQVLSSRNVHRQPRPVSMMTFMSASTKLGEIPDHRLPDRILTQEEQGQIPMPYVVPDMLEPQKRKNRGLKFWKKQERSPLGQVTN